MPVADHPVHPKTQFKRVIAGCFNRKGYAEGEWMRDGYLVKIDPLTGEKVAIPKLVWVPWRFEDDGCRGAIGQYLDGAWVDLPECVGCKAKKAEEYIKNSRLSINGKS